MREKNYPKLRRNKMAEENCGCVNCGANVRDPKSVRIDSLFLDVDKELEEEKFQAAKKKIKFKMKERQVALQVLANIDRDIAELKLELRNEL
jgi:hypothetical protein